MGPKNRYIFVTGRKFQLSDKKVGPTSLVQLYNKTRGVQFICVASVLSRPSPSLQMFVMAYA